MELFEIIQSDFYDNEIDREIDLLSCYTGKPEDYFLNLKMADFKKQSDKLVFLELKNITPEAKKYIKANGRTYAPIYNFHNVTTKQYVEIISFAKEPTKIIENLAKILASICVPTKLTISGKRKNLTYVTLSHK